MSSGYLERLREANRDRRQTELPNVAFLISIVISLTIAYIVFATGFLGSGELDAREFKSERGIITVLSAYFLVAAACFAIASFIVQVREQQEGRWVWLMLAIGFAFLAFDEKLKFHEQLGVFIGERVDSGVFRKWNDIIVLAYGIIALPIMLAILPILLRFRLVFELFAIAFLFYAVHTLVDCTQEPPTTVSHFLEESAKLLCGANLALGSVVGFLGTVWARPIIRRG